MALIEKLGRDPLVSSLLVLYGLHPRSLEARVIDAVERLAPKLQRDGAVAELLGIRGWRGSNKSYSGRTCLRFDQQSVAVGGRGRYLRSGAGCHGLSVEGLEGKPASGFVPLNQLVATGPGEMKVDVPASAPTVANYGD